MSSRHVSIWKPLCAVMTVIIPLILALPESQAAEPAPPAYVLEAARILSGHSEAKYEYVATEPSGNAPWLLSWFHYSGEEKGRNLWGRQYIIWNPDTRAIFWAKSWGGDFPPHSISWVDFDGDGDKDAIMLGGEEDVFWTEIYLWNPGASGYAPNALQRVYENHADYAVLLDLDGDGQAEILESGRKNEEAPEFCENGGFVSQILPADAMEAIRKEYFRLAGDFDSLNFHYNMPDAYPIFSMMPFDAARIIKIIKGEAVDVSARYPEHYRWRLEILNRIKEASNGTCKEIFDNPISHARTLSNAK